MKKKINLILCVIITMVSVMFSMPVMAEQENNTTVFGEIQPRTDIKEWVFKVENGNLYKRLYNYSTARWETDWIFVMSGVIEP